VDLRQLEYFRTVARMEHVTRASAELGLTQPALSRAIARLERELGVPLFHHAGRSIRLTRYGDAFLARIERALHEVDEGRRELADMTGAQTGTVALGFLRTLAAEYVPALIRRFRAQHPDVRFTFSQDNAAVLEQELGAGRLDLVFMPGPLEDTRLTWTHVFDQELVLIVPSDHRLAEREAISLRDVAAEPFVSFKAGHGMRRATDDLCAAAGFLPHTTFEGDESSAVRGFVAAGLGVAIVPTSGPSASYAVLRISKPLAQRSIGIVWVKERYRSETVRSFARFITG
jgi:DNA-binding transcriptional LysR family regulator